MASTVRQIDFNKILGDFFDSTMPEPMRGKDIESHKLHVFDTVFGKGVFKWNEKELTSKKVIIFGDSLPGAVGVKAVGIREKFFTDALKEIAELSTDPSFKLEVKDPVYTEVIHNIETRLIKIFADRQAKCGILEIQENKEYNAEMEAISQDLESASVLWEFIPESSETKFSKWLKRIPEYVSELNGAKTTKRYKTAIEFKDKIEKRAGSILSIAGSAAAFSAARGLWGRIPVLLGPVPLKHVNYIEVARSGKILKFRATGSVFLAKQEGGADAIKIEGTLYKSEFVFMFLLWSLFIYGQSKFREMENIPGFDASKVESVFDVRKLNDLITTDTSLEKPSYEYHQTFAFINRHFIIPNCYIETISIEDKLPLKDVLQYSILLRTYDKPKEVSWISDKKGRMMYGFSNKTTVAKVCEYSLNAAWRMLNAAGWILDEQEWKIGSALGEGVLDTYYDVDWTSLATVSYLNLMGVAT